MNRKIKGLLSVCVILVLVVVISIVSVKLYRNQSVEVKKYSFSEMNISQLSDLNEGNISSVLDLRYVENDRCCGFSDSSSMTTDLYVANSVVNLSRLMPGCDMKAIKETLSFVSSINIEDLDFLNLMYYVCVCDALDLDIDYPKVNEKLSDYYDDGMDMFYIDSESDSVNIKLIVTAMVKTIMKENLSVELFSPQRGVENVYASYSFMTEDEITFYNSGGDILYCISVFGMNDIVDVNQLMQWFEHWEEIYDRIEIDSITAALQYSEFINVARIFEPNYPITKLQDYYDNLTVKDLGETDDLYVYYNVFRNIDTLDNSEVNGYLKDGMTEIIESDSFVTLDIDIKSTVYGVLLGQEIGYSYDVEKLGNYVEQIYEADHSDATTYDKVSDLYYGLILDQLVNGYDQAYSKDYYQAQVDRLLDEIEYQEETLAAYIISVRRIVEIVSDLQLFGVDINLTRMQKNEIEDGLGLALENNLVRNSVLINDIYIVDEILSLGIITDNEFADAYNKLTVDGGSMSITGEEVIPDIESTFSFFSSLCMMNNYEYIQQQKEYVETLEIDDSVYVQCEGSEEIDLAMIVHGNAIRSYEVGGNKDDTAE